MTKEQDEVEELAKTMYLDSMRPLPFRVQHIETWEEIPEIIRITYRELIKKGYRKPSPALPTDKFVEILRKHWSFDNNQQHTHTWHDREDFIEKVLPSLLTKEQT